MAAISVQAESAASTPSGGGGGDATASPSAVARQGGSGGCLGFFTCGRLLGRRGGGGHGSSRHAGHHEYGRSTRGAAGGGSTLSGSRSSTSATVRQAKPSVQTGERLLCDPPACTGDSAGGAAAARAPASGRVLVPALAVQPQPQPTSSVTQQPGKAAAAALPPAAATAQRAAAPTAAAGGTAASGLGLAAANVLPFRPRSLGTGTGAVSPAVVTATPNRPLSVGVLSGGVSGAPFSTGPSPNPSGQLGQLVMGSRVSSVTSHTSRPSRWGFSQLAGLLSAGLRSFTQLARVAEPQTGALRADAVAEVAMRARRMDLLATVAQMLDLELLSQGVSRSLVFRGEWNGLRVCVKFVLASGPEGMTAPATEGLLSRVLDHRNIVQTYSWHVTRVTADDLEEQVPLALLAAAAAAAAAASGSVGGGGAGGTGGVGPDRGGPVSAGGGSSMRRRDASGGVIGWAEISRRRWGLRRPQRPPGASVSTGAAPAAAGGVGGGGGVGGAHGDDGCPASNSVNSLSPLRPTSMATAATTGIGMGTGPSSASTLPAASVANGAGGGAAATSIGSLGGSRGARAGAHVPAVLAGRGSMSSMMGTPAPVCISGAPSSRTLADSGSGSGSGAGSGGGGGGAAAFQGGGTTSSIPEEDEGGFADLAAGTAAAVPGRDSGNGSGTSGVAAAAVALAGRAVPPRPRSLPAWSEVGGGGDASLSGWGRGTDPPPQAVGARSRALDRMMRRPATSSVPDALLPALSRASAVPARAHMVNAEAAECAGAVGGAGDASRAGFPPSLPVVSALTEEGPSSFTVLSRGALAGSSAAVAGAGSATAARAFAMPTSTLPAATALAYASTSNTGTAGGVLNASSPLTGFGQVMSARSSAAQPGGGAASPSLPPLPLPTRPLTRQQVEEGWRKLQGILYRLNARPGDLLTRIVMEDADHGSLLAAIRADALREGGPLGGRRAVLGIALDVARGMAHLHAHNVIHGDLKPGNILLKSDPADPRGFVAKVSDFGLSRIAPAGTLDTPEPFGTVTSMAPEVIAGNSYRSSDVYSYSVVLWQMLSGEPRPWPGMHAVQVMMGVMSGELRLPPLPDAYPPLVALLEQCAAFDYRARPDFPTIVAQLQGLLQDEYASHGQPAPPLLPLQPSPYRAAAAAASYSPSPLWPAPAAGTAGGAAAAGDAAAGVVAGGVAAAVASGGLSVAGSYQQSPPGALLVSLAEEEEVDEESGITDEDDAEVEQLLATLRALPASGAAATITVATTAAAAAPVVPAAAAGAAASAPRVPSTASLAASALPLRTALLLPASLQLPEAPRAVPVAAPAPAPITAAAAAAALPDAGVLPDANSYELNRTVTGGPLAAPSEPHSDPASGPSSALTSELGSCPAPTGSTTLARPSHQRRHSAATSHGSAARSVYFGAAASSSQLLTQASLAGSGYSRYLTRQSSWGVSERGSSAAANAASGLITDTSVLLFAPAERTSEASAHGASTLISPSGDQPGGAGGSGAAATGGAWWHRARTSAGEEWSEAPVALAGRHGSGSSSGTASAMPGGGFGPSSGRGRVSSATGGAGGASGAASGGGGGGRRHPRGGLHGALALPMSPSPRGRLSEGIAGAGRGVADGAVAQTANGGSDDCDGDQQATGGGSGDARRGNSEDGAAGTSPSASPHRASHQASASVLEPSYHLPLPSLAGHSFASPMHAHTHAQLLLHASQAAQPLPPIREEYMSGRIGAQLSEAGGSENSTHGGRASGASATSHASELLAPAGGAGMHATASQAQQWAQQQSSTQLQLGQQGATGAAPASHSSGGGGGSSGSGRSNESGARGSAPVAARTDNAAGSDAFSTDALGLQSVHGLVAAGLLVVGGGGGSMGGWDAPPRSRGVGGDETLGARRGSGGGDGGDGGDDAERPPTLP